MLQRQTTMTGNCKKRVYDRRTRSSHSDAFWWTQCEKFNVGVWKDHKLFLDSDDSSSLLRSCDYSTFNKKLKRHKNKDIRSDNLSHRKRASVFPEFEALVVEFLRKRETQIIFDNIGMNWEILRNTALDLP